MANVQITPALPQEPDDWNAKRKPSLGEPVRELSADGTKATWHFTVAWGAAGRTLSAQEKQLRNEQGLTGNFSLTLDVSPKSPLANAQVAERVAFGMINELRGKFANLSVDEGQQEFDAIKSAKARTIHIVLIKESEDGPIKKFAVIWDEGKNGRFMLFRDRATGRTVKLPLGKKEDDLAANIALIKEMYHTKKFVHGPGGMPFQWHEHEGDLFFDFGHKLQRKKHQTYRDSDGYEDSAGAKANETFEERLRHLKYKDKKAPTATAESHVDPLEAGRTAAAAAARLGHHGGYV